MSASEPNLRCHRARLLLSLRADDAATPAQSAELDDHLAACADCRAAGTIDRAVGDHLRALAGSVGAVVVSAGFASRVVAAAVAERTAAAAQNRFLRRIAAAAALVAAVAGGSIVFDAPHPAHGRLSPREAARAVVFRPRLDQGR